MIALPSFVSEDECVYLPDRLSRLEYVYALRLSPLEYEARMNAGWRKFGSVLFRPVCRTCDECRPIRIDVQAFIPNRSQQRTVKRNADLNVYVGTPDGDAERLALYNRYQAAQTARKDWPDAEKNLSDYAEQFVSGPLPGTEISVRDAGGILKAVVLADVTPNTVSGVYHYYEPGDKERSIGAFAMLQTIELARHLEKPWAYFGYYVAGCASMAYKARFRPCQILRNSVWQDFAASHDAGGADGV